MSVNARKVVLLTREQGNNHFWDTSFSLRVPFRGNTNGEYKVTINEALFNNTEPLICKGDWFEFTVYDQAGSTNKFRWRVTMKKDYYLYKQGGPEWTAVINLLRGILGNGDASHQELGSDYQKVERYKSEWTDSDAGPHWGAETTYNWTMKYELKNTDNSEFTGTNRGVNPIMYYDLSNFKDTSDADIPNIGKIEMKYSWGFAYIFNNTNSMITNISNNDEKPMNYEANHFYFEFCNLRIGGPYGYVLLAPTIKTVVPTQNEANQAYSIVGFVKNTADNHNETVQFISSMEGNVNSLSNFRIQLLNDNFEPVRIRSPLYVNLTISNED